MRRTALVLFLSVATFGSSRGAADPPSNKSVPVPSGTWFIGTSGLSGLRPYGESTRPVGAGLPDFDQAPPEMRGLNVRPWQLATVIVHDSTGFGSGAIISADGWFLTNYHVVAAAAQQAALDGQSPVVMSVITCEDIGNRIRRRKVSGTAVLHRADPSRDLALMKIEKLPDGVAGMNHFPLASVEAEPGSDCIAIGSQGGGLPWGVRTGNVVETKRFPSEMTDRMIYAFDEEVLFERNDFLLVGSTCPISGGDSGGPLLNEKGELIGLTTGTPKNMSQGALGYHISVSEIRTFVDRKTSESVPFDPWTAGIPHSVKARPELVLFAAGGQKILGLRYVHCTMNAAGEPVPTAEELFLDFSPAHVEPTDQGILMPSGLWGMETKGRFPVDLFVASRRDKDIVAVGYGGKARVVEEIRIDLDRDRDADVIWVRDEFGHWKLERSEPGTPLASPTRLGAFEQGVLRDILSGIVSARK